ncbi:hypothetical protein CRUP_006342 [Coryphaenoides rupestris]|nr:hypothetical protein CRUP_006342 [Coryphaenoides rupestris]
MPSQLEGAMDALIKVFYNYSGNDGDKFKLNKGELKQLLNTELTDFLTSQKDPLLVEKIMTDLDSNKDNEVDFNEFVVLVAALTVACNDFFQEQQKMKLKLNSEIRSSTGYMMEKLQFLCCWGTTREGRDSRKGLRCWRTVTVNPLPAWRMWKKSMKTFWEERTAAGCSAPGLKSSAPTAVPQ